MRKLIPALLFVVVALVAGCGSDSGATWSDPGASAPGAGAPATSAAADPVEAIKQAMQRSLASTLTIKATVKAGNVKIEINGQSDQEHKVAQFTGKAPETIEGRVIGDAAYLKAEPSLGSKPWVKIDITKLKANSALRQSFDIKSQTGIIGGLTSAEKVGEGRYRGTADLEKAAESAGSNASMRDNLKSTAKLAKNPKAIPFEATVDGEGRLTALSYTIATTNLGDLVTDMTMSGFGEAVSVQPPPADEVEEASAEVYKFF